jgi:hypothetical protein
MAVYRALTDAQRRLRDAVCRRRGTLDDRLWLLAKLGRETDAESEDIEVVRGWLFEIHRRAGRQSC